MRSSSSPTGPYTLHADKEHSGIQFLVPLIMLGAGIIVYLVIEPLILTPLLSGTTWDGFGPFLRLVLSVILGVALGGAAESLLKERWPSGRWLRLDSDGLTIHDKEKAEERIVWDKRINFLFWRYPLHGFPRGGRERRISSGHYLLACRVLQDENSVIVHSYVSPKQAKLLPGQDRFVPIDMAELYGSNPLNRFGRPVRPSIPTALLSGRHGQIWTVERERWSTGMEFELDDFTTLMEALDPLVARTNNKG